MTDYFKLFDEKRRPWLEADALKEKFLRLSAEFHPDRTNSAGAEKVQDPAHYSELNAAYNCLRDHRARLQHLVALERGEKPSELQQIPPDLMELFFEVGRLCREGDELIKQNAATASPLLKAQLFESMQDSTELLRSLEKRIDAQRQELLNELKNLDERWPPLDTTSRENRELLLARFEEIYRLLSYYNRWTSQLKERLLQLSF
jgi:DnaJ-domain-containing protein 1